MVWSFFLSGLWSATVDPLPLWTEEGVRRLPVQEREGSRWVPLAETAQALGAELKPAGTEAVQVCFSEEVCALLPLNGGDRPVFQDEQGRLWIPLRTVPRLFRRAFRWDAPTGAFRAIESEGFRGELRPGERFPDLVLPDLNGDLVSLGGFRGRHRVIFTWASW
ncbi:MAG: hypothetical protein KatS3mg115_1250 [Candidatus Poribacteria bacterium]|nr:MAG: hypothetical protein KatS3mg115_1250 [Candidatus Poribacteria bacterium]